MPIQETSMVHAIIHSAHQSTFHSTYKHLFSHQSISHGTYEHSFSYPNILHCTHKTIILHTIAYCIAFTKHSYCKPVYKTRSSLEVCHSCVRFHIVRSFDTPEARSARRVSTANQFCCRRQQNMTFQTLYS